MMSSMPINVLDSSSNDRAVTYTQDLSYWISDYDKFIMSFSIGVGFAIAFVLAVLWFTSRKLIYAHMRRQDARRAQQKSEAISLSKDYDDIEIITE